MKWAIFWVIFILVLLSGCLDIITTKQKQMCLSATDYSNTSIYECTKNSECFKKVDDSGIIISEKIPFETKNKILTYKNNIASSIYYFNNAKKNIDKIYAFCSGQEDLKIIELVNDLMFYISRIFYYQDLGWQKSIEILKDYAIFLKAQGVEEISEEEIYSDFILLNKNVNELRDETINNGTYISFLKREAKNARDLASEFGFIKSYMSNVNYVDIYAYYSNYVENPEQELKIPFISKSTDVVFSKLSTFENFRKINNGLSKKDNYNLYILFDKHIGTNDSLFRKFIELNNKINNDIELSYKKIYALENEIDKNIEYLNWEKQRDYKKYKSDFQKRHIGFGSYFAKIKEYSLEIQSIKYGKLDSKELLQNKINDCDGIIENARAYKNLYFKKLINEYIDSNNPLKKFEICNGLKNALGNSVCFKDYELLVKANYLEEIEIADLKECIEVVNQLNYNLRNDEKIALFYEKLEENKKLIEQINGFDLGFEEQIQVIDYKSEIQELNELVNYELILSIDEYLNQLNKMNLKLIELLKNKVQEQIESHFEIKYFENTGYFLIVFNEFKDIAEVCFTPKDVNLSQIVSLDNRLKINRNEMCISQLIIGQNKYQIEYANQKSIITNIIKARIKNAFVETIVKNTVIGIKDALFLGPAELIDNHNYYWISIDTIGYITLKENKILYYQDIFTVEVLEKAIVEENGIEVLKSILKVKNKYNGDFCKDTSVIENDDSVIWIKENGKEKQINNYIDIGYVSINLCFKKGEEKIIEINKIQDPSKINSDVIEILAKINLLNNCEFADISAKSKKYFLELYSSLIGKETYNFEEINKVFSIENEVLKLEKEYREKQKTIDNVNYISSQILLLPLTSEEKTELNKIEDSLSADPISAQKKITILKEKIEKRIKDEKEALISASKQKLIDIVDVTMKFGLSDILESSINFTSDDLENIKDIEPQLQAKIKSKAEEANELIVYFNQINKKEVLNLIDEIDWIYDGISLKELYFVKYYPGITIDDAQRLKKKFAYIDTVSFKKMVSEFIVNYNAEDYVLALKKIDLQIIERLQDLNSEITLINNGLINIKEDAKKEHNDFLNSKHSKDNGILQKINEYYENKKFLVVIRELRLLKMKTISEKPKINYQLFVIIGGFSIIAIVGLFFKNKMPKKLSREEKKQKILRHY